MPPIFKALATITAWVLWIDSWVTGLSAFIMGIITGKLYGSGPVPIQLPIFFALAAAEAVLAVVVMILRKNME